MWGTLGDVMVLAMVTAVWGAGFGLVLSALYLEGPKRLWDVQATDSLASYLLAAVESRRAGGPDPLELEALTAVALAPLAPARPQRPRVLAAA